MSGIEEVAEVEQIEAEVAAAERKAADADRLAAEVLLAYESGATDLTEEQVAKQVQAKETVARFARSGVLRAQALLADARKRARLNELQKIRADIDEYSPKTGAKMGSLLEAMLKARAEFLDLVEEHNARVDSWASRLAGLGVAEPDHRPVPPAKNANLAVLRGNGLPSRVFSGRRSIDLVNGVGVLESLWTHRSHPEETAQVIGSVVTAAEEEPLPDYDYFYRGSGGQVLGRKNPYTKEEIERLELVEMTRAEAWSDEDGAV